VNSPASQGSTTGQPAVKIRQLRYAWRLLIQLALPSATRRDVHRRSPYFLAENVAIRPTRGPGRATAQFNVDVVAHTSDVAGQGPPPPRCLKCKKSTVGVRFVQDAVIAGICSHCHTERRISNWQGSPCNRRDRPPVAVLQWESLPLGVRPGIPARIGGDCPQCGAPVPSRVGHGTSKALDLEQ
jgi:hypothetical protein